MGDGLATEPMAAAALDAPGSRSGIAGDSVRSVREVIGQGSDHRPIIATSSYCRRRYGSVSPVVCRGGSGRDGVPRRRSTTTIPVGSECHPDRLGAEEHLVACGGGARTCVAPDRGFGWLASSQPRRTTRRSADAHQTSGQPRGSVAPGRLSSPPDPQKLEQSRIFDQPLAAWGKPNRWNRFTRCRWHDEASLSTQAYRSNLACNGRGLVVSVRQGRTGSSGGSNF
jgi:hypothetical protein